MEWPWASAVVAALDSVGVVELSSAGGFLDYFVEAFFASALVLASPFLVPALVVVFSAPMLVYAVILVCGGYFVL